MLCIDLLHTEYDWSNYPAKNGGRRGMEDEQLHDIRRLVNQIERCVERETSP